MTDNKISGTLKISSPISGTLSADHVTYSSGVKDYTKLDNKPALVYDKTRVELIGDVTMMDFGLREESLQPLTNSDIDTLFRR